MENEETSTNAECLSRNAKVRLDEDLGAKPWRSQRGQPHKTGTRRCKLGLVSVFIALLALIILGPTLTFFLLRGTQKEPLFSTTCKQNQDDVSPEAPKLLLEAIGADSFTASWERPKGHFDYYWVEVSARTSGANASRQIYQAGSCAAGRILHPNETRVTCDRLQACTNITFTLRTHRNGPPEWTSFGTVLSDIFIPGKEPDSPQGITMLGESPSRSLLMWAGPTEASGVPSAYTVNVCISFSTCDTTTYGMSCTTYETSVASLHFDSTVDTEYCVVLTSTTHCGGDVIRSQPVAAVFRTPAFRPPDVTMAKLTASGNHSFTVSWQRPEGFVDYYWINVSNDSAGASSSEERRVGSCVSGALLPPHTTQVSCESVKSCTNASLTIYTHVNGPPERTSRGITIQGIFIPGTELDPPRNITFTWKSSSITRVQWNPSTAPWALMTLYSVQICNTYGVCDAAEQLSNCTHHETPNTWLEYETNADTEYCILVMSTGHCGSNIVRSTPELATVRTPTFVPRDVTNFTLEDIEVDSFTVTWERPNGHFDYYCVAITDYDGGTGGSEHYHQDSCRNGTVLHPYETGLTYSRLEACTKVSVTIWTYTNGPPVRSSAGVTLRGIFIPGAAPGDFGVDATVTSNTSVQIVAHVAHVKSCLLDKCDGECYPMCAGGPDSHLHFTCNDHGGLTSIVTLDGLEPGSRYACRLALTNVYKGRNMRTVQYLYFNIPM